MKKDSIVFKLTNLFVLISLLSLVTASTVFIYVFNNYHVNEKIEIMLSNAKEIAKLDNILDSENNHTEVIDSFVSSRVWIFDKDGLIVTRSVGQYCHMEGTCDGQISNYNLEVIEKILTGREIVEKNNKTFYHTSTILVGVPIYNDDQVVGAVILNSTTQELNAPIKTMIFFLLIIIIITLGIIAILSYGLSSKITKTFQKIKTRLMLMRKGNYEQQLLITTNDELEELASDINQLSEDLLNASKERSKLDKMRQDFVANVSHEFRTPLTILRSNAELISSYSQDEVVKKSSEDIIAETEILSNMIENLLQLSQFDAGKVKLNKEKINLKSLIEDVVRGVGKTCLAKNIKLITYYEKESLTIKSDYYYIRQLLTIFITNACKYSKEFTNIEITLTKDKKIVIKDHGIGIDEKELPFVWDRFYKGKTATESSKGLGLSIAKNLVEVLQVTINLESVINEGTTVTIDFKEKNEK